MPRDGWRVITIRQPWAASAALGFKLIENRSMGHRWRGPLAIHAGVGWSDRGIESPLVREVMAAAGGLDEPRRQRALTKGAVISVCDLVDVHPDAGCCRPWGESTYQDAGGGPVRRVWHYQLERMRLLEVPLPARGMLGLWRPDPDLAVELDAVR